jgi:aminoglycoside phosphotransferase (APT) family kinase protein
VEDGRQRAAREFGALNALHTARADIAPDPIAIDTSKTILPYPMVIYRWAEGAPLQAPIGTAQLREFLDSYHQLHSVKPASHPTFQLTAWFHWFDFKAYLDEIQELADLYTPWLAKQKPDGNALADRLRGCIAACASLLAKTDISPKQEQIPLRLMRVDPNSANAILAPDGHIRWVDWEYSGWGDPALDLAELRWHAALQPLGNAALQWLRANYRLSFEDPGFYDRLHIWDHILATRWPLLILRALWSSHNGPDRERLSQVNTPSAQYYLRLRVYLERAETIFDGNNR